MQVYKLLYLCDYKYVMEDDVIKVIKPEKF